MLRGDGVVEVVAAVVVEAGVVVVVGDWQTRRIRYRGIHFWISPSRLLSLTDVKSYDG